MACGSPDFNGFRLRFPGCLVPKLRWNAAIGRDAGSSPNRLPCALAVRVRGLLDEPAGNSLNNLPQSMVCSWCRLVCVCFHACRVYGKTDKATLLFKVYRGVSAREIVHSTPMGWQ